MERSEAGKGMEKRGRPLVKQHKEEVIKYYREVTQMPKLYKSYLNVLTERLMKDFKGEK